MDPTQQNPQIDPGMAAQAGSSPQMQQAMQNPQIAQLLAALANGQTGGTPPSSPVLPAGQEQQGSLGNGMLGPMGMGMLGNQAPPMTPPPAPIY